ncbi:MAG: butyrate kinase [Clostridioides sp.]|jgi:butyrate kinase|nr:butyrate kinase [Clostridioides sp.]
MEKYRVLAINPGSTSTKIAVYDDEEKILTSSIDYTAEEIDSYANIIDQFDMRSKSIIGVLEENDIHVESLNAVVGRGGALTPVNSGAYEVNDEMVDFLRNRPVIEHASNLGGVIAKSIADPLGIKAYIYDAVAVDEMSDLARVTGIKGIERPSFGHALNTRAMALKYAKDNNLEYKDLNLIVAHVGGGATVYLHNKGRISDMLSDDEGPMSPQRSGRIPGGKLVDLCFSGEYSKKEIMTMIRGKGGIVSHLNTVDVREVEKMIEDGDKKAELIYDAMIYQIAKGVGEMATVVDGDVDAIIVTGGIAYSEKFSKALTKRIQFISKVAIMAGENELESLAFGALRVLKGEEKAWQFTENK